MIFSRKSFIEDRLCGTIDSQILIQTLIHQLAESLSRTIDVIDYHTANHSEEVAIFSFIIALSYGLNESEAELIHIAGHLHDIGKISIPQNILKKEGKLTEEEWNYIKRHPIIGADILKPIECFMPIANLVLYHHERWDGKGYPLGLKGEEIPIGARIISVADAISAMLEDRPYRKALDFNAMLSELNRSAGYQFDPQVVKATMEVKDHIHRVKKNLMEDKNDTPCFGRKW